MARIDTWFLRIALLYLIAGMIAGIWLGSTHQFQFSNFHAHINLVGFVVTGAIGLIHRAYPAPRTSRLSPVHFWLHNAGTLVLVVGKYVVDATENELVVAIGSLIILLATLLFVYLFFRNAEA